MPDQPIETTRNRINLFQLDFWHKISQIFGIMKAPLVARIEDKLLKCLIAGWSNQLQFLPAQKIYSSKSNVFQVQVTSPTDNKIFFSNHYIIGKIASIKPKFLTLFL